MIFMESRIYQYFVKNAKMVIIKEATNVSSCRKGMKVMVIAAKRTTKWLMKPVSRKVIWAV